MKSSSKFSAERVKNGTRTKKQEQYQKKEPKMVLRAPGYIHIERERERETALVLV